MAKIEPALISSFSVKGCDESVKQWPTNVSNVELYAFMQSDLKNYFISLKQTADEACPNALCVMADQWKNQEVCDSVASIINDRYKGKSIIAFATFLPELTSFETNEAVWTAPQQAQCFLIALSRALQRFGHPISTIQIAGGSRTDGVDLISNMGFANSYTVNRLCIDKAVDRLIERLGPVAKFALIEPKIQIAVELEPGPWFTIGEAAALKKFCERIDSDPKNPLYSVVGVNLDIPHWDFLSGITVDWLQKPENDVVRKRIIHCHISDHSNGHFGCHVTGTFHPGEFEEWIQLVVEQGGQYREPNYPKYSGYISCEMEGCKHKEFVQQCVDELIGLLATVKTQDNVCTAVSP